jgi:hypothetical protein
MRKRSGVKKGQWVIALDMIENSQATPLDACLVVFASGMAASSPQEPLRYPLQTPRDRSLSPSPQSGQVAEIFSKLNDLDPKTIALKSE